MASEELNRLAALLQERLDVAAGGPVPLAPEPPAPPPSAVGTAVSEPGEGTEGEGSTGASSEGDAPSKKPLVLPPGATVAGALEAILLIANEPMSVFEIMKVLEGATRAEVNGALRELRERYAARSSGFELVEIAGGIRLLSRPEYAPWVERLEKVRREERLSRAQLEVLAVIAYRQPLVRADVDSVRGADSGGALRGLLDKGLVKVVGRADQLGRPLLYGTTDRFLERFCLKSVKDLPRPKADA